MSTCLAGNQCWDCEIVNKVYQQLLLSTRTKRQAYNFTADPRRQWSMPISYLFNNTIASSNSAGTVFSITLANILRVMLMVLTHMCIVRARYKLTLSWLFTAKCI